MNVAVAFHRPGTVQEALALLGDDENARPLAGGQSLVAMLNLGLLEPSAVVTLAGIAEFHGISRGSDGNVRVGAMCTHAEVASSTAWTAGQHLLAQAAGSIADPAIRAFGTIGGACAHNDPAGDWPAALVAAEARMEIAAPAGRRQVAAGDFFQQLFTTALAPGELLAAVLVPPLAGRGHYVKLPGPGGSFNAVSVAVVGSADGRGRCTAIRVALGACGPRPLRLREAEDLLNGKAVDGTLALEAGERLAAAIDPEDDRDGYRRRVVPGLVARAVLQVLSTEVGA